MEHDYQRSEMRADAYGGGRLTWDDGNNSARTSNVIVRNLSDQGLQVLCGQPIRTGARVFLTGDTYECFGEVRYCVYGEDGYRIGIQFKRNPYVANPPAAGPV